MQYWIGGLRLGCRCLLDVVLHHECRMAAQSPQTQCRSVDGASGRDGAAFAACLFGILAWPAGLMDTGITLMGAAPMKFLAVALGIGLLCSWVAMICWNKMSQILPAALGGQLIVFESVFAVIYALMWRGGNADAVDDDWLRYLDGRRARFASRFPEAHGILDRRHPRTHPQNCGCCQPCRTSGGRHPRQLTAPELFLRNFRGGMDAFRLF